MRRLGRKGRVLKWAGLMVSLSLLFAFVATNFCMVTYFPAGQHWALWLCGGRVLIDVWPGTGTEANPRDSFAGWRFWNLRSVAVGWWIGGDTHGVTHRLAIPLWLVVLPIAIPTGFLWWYDRRRIPPGHCQRCGYDLTGNTSGTCPECGSALPGELDA